MVELLLGVMVWLVIEGAVLGHLIAHPDEALTANLLSFYAAQLAAVAVGSLVLALRGGHIDRRAADAERLMAAGRGLSGTERWDTLARLTHAVRRALPKDCADAVVNGDTEMVVGRTFVPERVPLASTRVRGSRSARRADAAVRSTASDDSPACGRRPDQRAAP